MTTNQKAAPGSHPDTACTEQRFDIQDFTTLTAPEPSATDLVEIARNWLREVVLLCGPLSLNALIVAERGGRKSAVAMLARVLAADRSKAGAA